MQSNADVAQLKSSSHFWWYEQVACPDVAGLMSITNHGLIIEKSEPKYSEYTIQ